MDRLFLLLGEDDFQKSSSLNKIKTKFLDKSSEGLNYHVFFGKEVEINEILESTGTSSTNE